MTRLPSACQGHSGGCSLPSGCRQGPNVAGPTTASVRWLMAQTSADPTPSSLFRAAYRPLKMIPGAIGSRCEHSGAKASQEHSCEAVHEPLAVPPVGMAEFARTRP